MLNRSAALLILLAIASSSISGLQVKPVQVRDQNQPKLRDFRIVRPLLVIEGDYLSSVAVRFFSTGTGITESGLLGNAKRTTVPGKNEKWVLDIPPGLLAVEIFAVAYDSHHKEVGRRSLPNKGASDIDSALYGPPDSRR
jgi:hypothetical protein